ncbi:BatD family protein [Caldithrix abyssi]|nr:BatD family protein [Caldithrix abyssi]
MFKNKRLSSAIIIVLSILFWGNQQLFSQDIQIRSYVSKNKVGINENFTYSIEVSGKSTSLPDPVAPDFKDFYVLSGPNTSTSIQFVNGRMSATKVHTYYLQPKKKGQLNIPPATVKRKGKTIKSNAITITVVDQPQTAQKPSRQRKAPKKTTDRDLLGQSIYLKTEVSKRKAYVGEQIVVAYKLYFRVNVSGYDFKKLPSNPGFWTEEFEMPGQPIISSEIVNGLNYNVATIRKIAIFPTQSGELTLEPISVMVEARVQRRSRSIFDSFFDDPFGRVVQKTLSSKPIKIKVMELPQEGRPADFNGAVGRYNLDVKIDKTDVKTNDAVSLKVTIAGEGNIKMVNVPDVIVPPDIEKYDPKIKTELDNVGARIRGKKKAEIILIPRVPGDFLIKPLTFSYFDPQTGKYVTLRSKAIPLHVSGQRGVAMSQPLGGGASLDQRYVDLIGRDIRFIKEFSQFQPVGYKIYRSFKFWGLIGFGFIFLIVFVLVNDYQARISGDERLVRSRKAGRMAAKQLSKARDLLKSGEYDQFYRAVSNALQGFVRDKLNIDLSDFSTPTVRKHLNERKIDPAVVDEYIAVLEEADFRQFANIPDSPEERQKFYDRAKKVLTSLEKWI